MRSLATALLLANVQAKDLTSTKDVIEGLKGFLEGAIQAEGLDNIETCIKDAEALVVDAEAAYGDCTVHDLSHKVKCTKDIAVLTGAAKHAITDCKNIKGDVKKLEAMAEIFASPTSFLWHTAKDLVVNGIDIFHEVQDAMKAFKAKDFKTFGLQMGEATAKVLIGSQMQGLAPKDIELTMSQPAPKKALTKEEYAAVIKGMFAAFGKKIDILALLICIQDEDKALMAATLGIQNFEMAIGEWKSGDKGSAIGDMIGSVLIELAAYQSFEQGVPACKAIIQDEKFAEFTKAKKDFNLMSFEPYKDDLQVHGYSILYIIEEAMAAYEHADFEQFGEKMGEILKLTQKEHAQKKTFQLKEAKPQSDMTDMAELMQGFFEGAKVGKMSFMELLVCIYQADQSALMLYSDIELWEEAFADKSWFEGLFAVVFLFAFGSSVRSQVLPACMPLHTPAHDWTSFDKMVAVAEDPISHLDLVGRDIMLNGASISEGIKEAGEACIAKKFYDCGFALSTVLMDATTSKGEELFLY